MGTRSKTSLYFVLHGLVYTHPSTAANLPYLPGSSALLHRVLTSLVPPVHYQGVSLAPLQGLALWNIFLPTTGSFFVSFITDFLPSCNSTSQWTFSCCIPFFILPATVAGLSIPAFSTQMLKPTTIYCFLIFLCCHYRFRPYDITQHLLTIIIDTFCQYRVEDPDQLARNRYD